MTTISFTSVPTSQRIKEEGKQSLRGCRIVQFGQVGLTIDAGEGWHELGYLTETDYNSQVENYIPSGGVPEVDLGVRKNSHKKAFSFTVSYPEDMAFAFAKGLSAPTYNQPGTPNTTLVVSSTATTVTVTATEGANFSAGDLIFFPVGDSTNGTANISRRIESISTDTLTLDRPMGEQPEVGATVAEVESIDYVESTDDYGDPISIRFIENDNYNSALAVEQVIKFQPTYGNVQPGPGLDEYLVTITGNAIGNYDSANDRYTISQRRYLALNS